MKLEDYTADDDDVRPWLKTPFLIGGMDCAGDGYRLLAQPASGKYKPPEKAKFSRSVVKILDKIKTASYQPMPAISDMPPKDECRHCLGTGKATINKCPECDGWGEVTARTDHNEYDVECKSCEGTGTVVDTDTSESCPTCDGTGLCYNRPVGVTVLGKRFQYQLIEPLLSESVEVGLVDADTESWMLAFRCGEQIGAIMGFRK